MTISVNTRWSSITNANTNTNIQVYECEGTYSTDIWKSKCKYGTCVWFGFVNEALFLVKDYMNNSPIFPCYSHPPQIYDCLYVKHKNKQVGKMNFPLNPWIILIFKTTGVLSRHCRCIWDTCKTEWYIVEKTFHSCAKKLIKQAKCLYIVLPKT